MNKKMPQIMNIPIHWGGKVANVGLIIMFIIHLILLVTHAHTFPFPDMSLTRTYCQKSNVKGCLAIAIIHYVEMWRMAAECLKTGTSDGDQVEKASFITVQ